MGERSIWEKKREPGWLLRNQSPPMPCAGGGLFFCWPKKRGEKKGLGENFSALGFIGENLIHAVGFLSAKAPLRCAAERTRRLLARGPLLGLPKQGLLQVVVWGLSQFIA